MESAWLRGPAAVAADDVETGCFSELQPLPYGDANASPADAQARTSGELLWELNKACIHQGMILRKLAETEHAIAMRFTAAGHNAVPTLPWSQDYWQFRTPLVPLHPPCSSTEHPPCGSRDPAAVRVHPLYPRVEWSPPPLLQPESTSDTEKQQDCGSSGARTHSFDGYVELCRSPNKLTMAEEASVPAAANAGVQPIAVTPGHKDGAVGECKDEVEDGHAVHPSYESGNQSSGQGKAAGTTPVDQINVPILQPGRYMPASQESAALDQQKVREFSVPTREQPQLGNGAEQRQDCSSPGMRAHVFNGYVELCLSPSKQTPVEETLVPMAAKAGISPIPSALSFGKEAASGHQGTLGGEPKADVEDDHDVQPLGEIRNQSSEQRKAVESAMEDRNDKATGLPAGQHRSESFENAAYNEQKKVESSEFDLGHEKRKAVESALKDQTDKPAELLGQHRSASLENAAYNEEKKVEFSERKAVESALKDQTDKPTGLPGQHRSASLENAAYNKHKKVEYSKFDLDHEQRKAVESAMEDQADKATGLPGQYMSASLENPAYNEQKKVEFGESADERTSAGVKRKLNAATSSVKKKKKKKLGNYSCTICYVNMPSHRHLEEHMAGKLHRRNLTALQSPRNGAAEPNTKATPVSKRITETNTESSCRDSEENTVEGSGSQQGGKPHPKSLPNGKGCGTGKKADCKSELYCKLCNLQCDHEKILASHLAGKKHRRRKERERMLEATS